MIARRRRRRRRIRLTKNVHYSACDVRFIDTCSNRPYAICTTHQYCKCSKHLRQHTNSVKVSLKRLRDKHSILCSWFFLNDYSTKVIMYVLDSACSEALSFPSQFMHLSKLYSFERGQW
jgi:hypothetical protein